MRAIILILALAGASIAYAHGDAEWIQKQHPICCGPTDCVFVPNRDVYRTAEGWKVAGYGGAVPHDKLLPSIDDHWWACEDPAGRLSCLFNPQPKTYL